MPTVNVMEARTCFVQAARTLEKFGKANADKHLVELELDSPRIPLEHLLSTFDV